MTKWLSTRQMGHACHGAVLSRQCDSEQNERNGTVITRSTSTPCPPCAPSQEGDTPVELARVFGKWKVVEILEKAAATKGR